MLDTNIAPSGGYYNRPFGAETEEEREARRKRISGYYNGYMEFGGDAHESREALAEIAKNLGTSTRQSHNHAAASALAEINLRFPAEDWEANQAAAKELLERILDAPQTKDLKYFEAKLLYICLPLYAVPAMVSEMSQRTLATGLSDIALELLDLAQEVEDTEALRASPHEAPQIVGRANEAVLIAALLHTDITNKGLLALPAFTWQDKGTIAKEKSTGKNPRFDINVVDIRTGAHIMPIQAKTKAREEDAFEYTAKTKVVEANKIMAMVADELNINVNRFKKGNLHSMFAGANVHVISTRLKVLRKVLIGELGTYELPWVKLHTPKENRSMGKVLSILN